MIDEEEKEWRINLKNGRRSEVKMGNRNDGCRKKQVNSYRKERERMKQKEE